MYMQKLVELMMLYSHTKAEIATLQAKNQAAPKYLHTQAQDLMEQISSLAYRIDMKLQALSYTGNE